jgi:hypothetical protein
MAIAPNENESLNAQVTQNSSVSLAADTENQTSSQEVEAPTPPSSSGGDGLPVVENPTVPQTTTESPCMNL